jgi:putative endonuclease
MQLEAALPRDSNARRAARGFGLTAEAVAAFWLRARLYRIIEQNYRVKGGEVDIIARRGATIVFVEVKARGALEDAAIAITPQKQRRISRAANRWVATHPWAAACTLRADAVFIAPGRLPWHLENAFALAIG